MSQSTIASGEIRSLVLVPALVTLAVTLLRLAGELLQGSELLFSRAAGGAAAIVGIVWLVPVFGVLFALRLMRMGYPPASRGCAILWAVLAAVAIPFQLPLWASLGLPPVAQVVAFCAGAAVIAFGVAKAWPVLGRVLLAYGLLARIPVAIIMLLAILGSWGTHYELGRPDLPPLEPPLVKWLVIGLVPQIGFWVSFTVVVGLLFGSLAAAIAARRAV